MMFHLEGNLHLKRYWSVLCCVPGLSWCHLQCNTAQLSGQLLSLFLCIVTSSLPISRCLSAPPAGEKASAEEAAV